MGWAPGIFVMVMNQFRANGALDQQARHGGLETLFKSRLSIGPGWSASINMFSNQKTSGFSGHWAIESLRH